MKPFDDSDSSPETGGDRREFHSLSFVHTPAPKDKIEGSVFIKMSAGAVVITALVAIVSIRVIVAEHGENAKIEPYFATVKLLSSATVGAMIGGLLALKDRIQRKLEIGEHVSYILHVSRSL